MNRTPKRIILPPFSLVFVMVTPADADGLGVNTGEWAKYGDFSACMQEFCGFRKTINVVENVRSYKFNLCTQFLHSSPTLEQPKGQE